MNPMEYRGKHAVCKVYTERLDENVIQQIHGFLESPVFDGVPIRIMPDVHAGKGAVIGFTAPLGDKVIPNVIGVDIGCGVSAVPLKVSKGEIDFGSFDVHLRESVPAGFKIRKAMNPELPDLYKRWVDPRKPWSDFKQGIEDLSRKIGDDVGRTWLSCGTLGGGNHFIEIGRDEDTHELWLVVHSGSRHFGLAVAQHHQRKASDKRGKQGELAWLGGEDAQEYLRDMRLAQKFAHLNRVSMLDALVGFFDQGLDGFVQSVHNFIGDDDMIRKGAISAHEGERVIIPWNMRDGMILGVGKGNPEWNHSAPHGAGRKMSRSAARKRLDVKQFEKTMKDAGVWTSCVGKATLDEAPGAYKEPGDILDFLAETIDVSARLKPVYNFKAGK